MAFLATLRSEGSLRSSQKFSLDLWIQLLLFGQVRVPKFGTLSDERGGLPLLEPVLSQNDLTKVALHFPTYAWRSDLPDEVFGS